VLAEVNYQEMVVSTGHIPVVAIERCHQIFRGVGDRHRVAAPDFDFMRLLHLPQGKRNANAGAKDAFQDCRDGFGSSVNGLKCDERLLFQTRPETLRCFARGRLGLTTGTVTNRFLLGISRLRSQMNWCASWNDSFHSHLT